MNGGCLTCIFILVYSQNCTIYLVYEEEVGWDYYGSDIKPGRETRTNPNQPIAEAKAECIMDCLQTEGCKVWEFIGKLQ